MNNWALFFTILGVASVVRPLCSFLFWFDYPDL